MDLLKYYYNLRYTNGNLFPNCRTKIIPVSTEMLSSILTEDYLAQLIDTENAINVGKYIQNVGFNSTLNTTLMNVSDKIVYYPERFLFVLPKEMNMFLYEKDTFIPEDNFKAYRHYTIEDVAHKLNCTAIAVTVYCTHPNHFWTRAEDKDFILKMRDLAFYLGTEKILHISDNLEKGFILEDNKETLLSKIEKWKEIIINNFIARCKHSVSHLSLHELPYQDQVPLIRDWE